MRAYRPVGTSVLLVAAILGLAGCSAGGGGGFPLGSGTAVGSTPDAAETASAGDDSGSYGTGDSSGVGTGNDDGSPGSPAANPGACDPSCTGCCDTNGNCNTSALDSTCGNGGAACEDCTQVGQTCQGGLCAGVGGGSSGGASGGGGTSGSGSSSGGRFGGSSSSSGGRFGGSSSSTSSGGSSSGGYDAGRNHRDGG